MITIKGGSDTAGLVNVTADHELNVALNTNPNKAGYAALGGGHDEGIITGIREVLPVDVSGDFRVRVGTDNMIFNEIFSGTVINTSKWATPLDTATIVQAGGFLTLNAVGSVATTKGCILKSWKTFQTFSAFGTYVEIRASIATTSFNNTTVEWGAGLTAGTVNVTATDGVFFRYTTAGLSCVVMNNNVELVNSIVNPTQLALIAFDITKVNHYIIFMDDDSCEFWINDVLVYSYDLKNNSTPALTASQQLFIYARLYMSSANSLTAQKLNISSISVSIADMETALPFAHRMALMQEHCQILPSNGVSTGSTLTAGITNVAIPATATTVSAVALGTSGVAGLGGYQTTSNATGPSLTADTAWIMFSYLVPAPVIAAPISPAKGIMLTGMDFFMTSRIVAGTNAGPIPCVVELNYGCTNISPATAEAITTQTTPVKGVRRAIIGFINVPITTPIGTSLGPISWKPQTPVLCEAGTYIQIAIRPLVTWVLANTQALVCAAAPDGYWV